MRVQGKIQRWAGALLALLLLGGCQRLRATPTSAPTSPAAGRDLELALTVGALERTFTLHLPPGYDGQRALPVVIVLHGGGGNAASAASMSGMSAKADGEGFIAAYPNGTGQRDDRLLTWNAGSCCAYAAAQNSDDVGFIRALIELLKRDYQADPRRMFVSGMSNGGMMSYRLACELSDQIAAIAPVAGALNYAPCQPSQPVAVVIFHGTADQHVLYDGGPPQVRADPTPRVDASVKDALDFWTRHNQCTAAPARSETASLIHETYGACRNNAEVALYTIVGGGHSWPGGAAGRADADPPSPAISATDAMWTFFAAHPKP
jgi:polyhydroxybutyrate depolymerase